MFLYSLAQLMVSICQGDSGGESKDSSSDASGMGSDDALTDSSKTDSSSVKASSESSKTSTAQKNFQAKFLEFSQRKLADTVAPAPVADEEAKLEREKKAMLELQKDSMSVGKVEKK